MRRETKVGVLAQTLSGSRLSRDSRSENLRRYFFRLLRATRIAPEIRNSAPVADAPSISGTRALSVDASATVAIANEISRNPIVFTVFLRELRSYFFFIRVRATKTTPEIRNSAPVADAPSISGTRTPSDANATAAIANEIKTSPIAFILFPNLLFSLRLRISIFAAIHSPIARG
jgi:hypothetical protein